MTEAVALYDPPSDLPREEDTSSCETDISLRLTEPNVTNVLDPQGFVWTGIPGVTVTLMISGKRQSVTTSANGTARFEKVPCGVYTANLSQRDFRIEPIDSKDIKVSALRKSGREFELRILRKLRLVEMFRAPTSLADTVRSQVGIERKTTLDDTYGHHWLKIYRDVAAAGAETAQESYGWWPARGALTSNFDTFSGVQGALNGYVRGGLSYPRSSPTTDPYQDDPKYTRGSKYLEESFFPYVTNGYSSAEYINRIRSKAQKFSTDVTDQWSWITDSGGWHCKTFQAYLMREARVWKRVGVRAWSGGWTAST